MDGATMGATSPRGFGRGYHHLLQVAVAAQLEDDAHVDVGVVVAPAAADELRDETRARRDAAQLQRLAVLAEVVGGTYGDTRAREDVLQ